MTGSFSVRELRSDDRSLLLAATLGNLNWQEARFTEQEILERSELRHYVDVRFDRGDFGWVAEDDGVAVGAAWVANLLAELRDDGIQVLMATHSPILTAIPGARIVELDEDGFHTREWKNLMSVALYRRFLADPGYFGLD